MSKNYANQFLLPLPVHEGSYFDGSLTFVCNHSKEGALGLIVNRPTNLDLNTLLEATNLKHDLDPSPSIFEGGPVHQGAPSILHTDDFMVSCTMPLTDTPGLAFTPPTDMEDFEAMLRCISEKEGPNKYLVAVGYAGWHEGQLDREISENVWLTCPSSLEILFDSPVETRADLAAETIGVDLSLLAGSPDGLA